MRLFSRRLADFTKFQQRGMASLANPSSTGVPVPEIARPLQPDLTSVGRFENIEARIASG